MRFLAVFYKKGTINIASCSYMRNFGAHIVTDPEILAEMKMALAYIAYMAVQAIKILFK